MFFVSRNIVAALFAAVLAAVTVGAAAQASMTPARYVRCQTAAHLATLAGLEERLALTRRAAGAEEHRRADEASRARVDRAYANCGSSVGALGAYAYRNDEQIRSWLAANPTPKAVLESVQSRIASTGAQLGSGGRAKPSPQRRER